MSPALILIATLASGQLSPYVRSRVDTGIPGDPDAHCLWWPENSRIEYRQHQRGDTDNPDDSEFGAINRSFESWQSLLNGCGSLSMMEGARTTLTSVGHDPAKTDNQNIVIFRSRACTSVVGQSDSCWAQDECMNKYDCWAYSTGTIALTTTVYDPASGRVLGGDFELNGKSFLFTTVDAPPCPPGGPFNYLCVATDVQNTMTHEIGHLLGLDHTSVATSTMARTAPPGETSKRTIDSGSAQFLCDTYPKDRPAKDCVILKTDPDLGPAVGCGCGATEGLWALWGLAAWALRPRSRRSLR